MEALDFALRVTETVAFSLHSVIGLTEPCHKMMNTLTEDSLPYPSLFFPFAGIACRKNHFRHVELLLRAA